MLAPRTNGEPELHLLPASGPLTGTHSPGKRQSRAERPSLSARAVLPVNVGLYLAALSVRSVRGKCVGFGPIAPEMPRRSSLVVQKPVSVPVDDHPLTVLSPVDVRDAGAHRRHRAAPKGRRDLLEADGVGQSLLTPAATSSKR